DQQRNGGRDAGAGAAEQSCGVQRANRRRRGDGGDRGRRRQFAGAGESSGRGAHDWLIEPAGKGIEMNMLETSKPNGQFITANVRLEHAVGMHARPAVKLTKLAKTFQAQISIRASDTADWINAKSVAKVMALRAAYHSVIQIKASGVD